MTYNVFSGTLNPAQSINSLGHDHLPRRWHHRYEFIYSRCYPHTVEHMWLHVVQLDCRISIADDWTI